jgi:hypothetical protein
MADRDYEISERLLGTADVQSMTLRAEFQLLARLALIEAQVHSARRSGDESKVFKLAHRLAKRRRTRETLKKRRYMTVGMCIMATFTWGHNRAARRLLGGITCGLPYARCESRA